MTTRKDTIRKAADKVMESRVRVMTAHIRLLTHALELVAKEGKRKDGSLFAAVGTAEAALAGGRRLAAMKHPVPDPAEVATIVVPDYISGQEWLEQNPGVYAPKGR